MISEVYVPVPRLVDFMQAVAEDVRKHGTEVIYGTIRLIRKDIDTFLPWAKQDYACVVVNLRVEHNEWYSRLLPYPVYGELKIIPPKR